MIVLSLKCIGLANSSRKLAIKRLVETHNLSILFLQETMMEGEKEINFKRIIPPFERMRFFIN
jgi:hypothetical protein